MMKRMQRFVHRWLQKILKFLEIGCGLGNITQKVVQLKPEVRILATDVSPNMVEIGKKNNPTTLN
jgi:ubiquinone/menaquinone biosynthesis C-methylase UbiE